MTLQEEDFAEDIPTAEELKLLARGSLRVQKVPQYIEKRSEHLARDGVSRSNVPQSQAASQRSSSPPTSPNRPNTANGTGARERCSSVSLDHEESDEERETTPTPAIRNRAATEDAEAKKDGEDGEGDDSTSEEEEEEDKSEDEATKSQPAAKKQKSDVGSSFLKKLTGSSQKGMKLSELLNYPIVPG